MSKDKNHNITLRVDNENKKVYVIGHDICLFIAMLATASYPGYEIKFEEN